MTGQLPPDRVRIIDRMSDDDRGAIQIVTVDGREVYRSRPRDWSDAESVAARYRRDLGTD